jgi:hypothetical protein
MRAMKTKRITLRVTEETYKRWQESAEDDERTLVTWICRRVDGRPTGEPAKEAAIPDKEVAINSQEASVTNAASQRGLLARLQSE